MRKRRKKRQDMEKMIKNEGMVGIRNWEMDAESERV